MRSGDVPSPDRLSSFSALSDYIKEQRDMQESTSQTVWQRSSHYCVIIFPLIKLENVDIRDIEAAASETKGAHSPVRYPCGAVCPSLE